MAFIVFFYFNAAAILAGLNLYPRHWPVLLLGAIHGNFLWLLIPLMIRGLVSPSIPTGSFHPSSPMGFGEFPDSSQDTFFLILGLI
jgi:hypothetical protein